tara:strand:+ start:477 stop:992 length:516 start_codon:yes stop_codon:yes gene_type:complete
MKISRRYKKGGNNTNIYINTKNNNHGSSNISPSDILDNPQVEKAINKAGVSMEEMKNYLTPAINELKKHLTPANLMKATIGIISIILALKNTSSSPKIFPPLDGIAEIQNQAEIQKMKEYIDRLTNARRKYEKQVLDMFKSSSGNATSGGKKTKKYKKYKNKTKRKRRRRR